MAGSDDNSQEFLEDANFNKFRGDAARVLWDRLWYTYAYDLMNEEVFMTDILPCSMGILILNPLRCEHVKNNLLGSLKAGWRMSFAVHDSGQDTEKDEAYFTDFNFKHGIYGFKLWWIILLRFYIQQTEDYTILDEEVQKEVYAIMEYLLGNSDRHPQLRIIRCIHILVPSYNNCSTGGQATLYFSLKCAHELMNLPQFKYGQNLNSTREQINNQIARMDFLIPAHNWVDKSKVEIYKSTLLDGGSYQHDIDEIYMNSNWSLEGNCIAILSSLATPKEAETIMLAIEKYWAQVIENYKDYNEDFRGLLWLLVAASIKAGMVEIAKRAVEIFEKRYQHCLPSGIGHGRSQSNWTYCGYLISKILIENDSVISRFSFEKANALKTEYLSAFLKQREKIIRRFGAIKKHFKRLPEEIEKDYKEWLMYCRNLHLQKICPQLGTNHGIDPVSAQHFLFFLGLCMLMDVRDKNWTTGPELIRVFFEEISRNSSNLSNPLMKLLHKTFNWHHKLMNNNLAMVQDLALETGDINLRDHLLEREDLYIPMPQCESFSKVVKERGMTGICLDCNNRPVEIVLSCGHKYSCNECFSKSVNTGVSLRLRIPYFCVICNERN